MEQGFDFSTDKSDGVFFVGGVKLQSIAATGKILFTLPTFLLLACEI